ncbi:topoisomerase C-terminal repeat-containing protein [Paenimyroides ummariense]|uniref:topoisomerase C-terminal repeat-containing protein n=1 Tax=Paenimyroides ummariense TaxID=913024 RepID=UPI0021CD6E74|nr:topoisomerase C-terminal repeat-containing protein [Paenimyroides ummariense]
MVKCTESSCDWIQFRMVCGVHLSISNIESLVTSGKTSLIKALKSKSGKKFDAYIVFDVEGKSSLKKH